MARLSALLLAIVLGAASAVALVSCGSGDDANLLPGTTADEIEANLDQVEQLAADGDCFGAEDAVAQVAAEVEELEGVDVRLKRALEDGTAKLSEVVGRCEEETTEETEPTLESDVDAEEVEDEKEKKPKKEKPEKEESAEPEEGPSEEEGPELPPQANGEGEEKGGGPPPAEPEAEETPSSGGVGPSVGVE
jgi:outer membrane biosynthesis protein TonB